MTTGVEDRALVEAVRRDDPAGLEGMYRRYADRLYTYARGMLREPEAAADAVHDAFLAARQNAAQLRDPDRLRPWLYAIVRNECLRRIRERDRLRPLEEAGEPPADPADHGAQVGAEQVRELVHSAAAALNPGDREVVDLALRHDLSSTEIGAALGVPANHAHARLSRARTQLERALGALVVARTGARDCPALAGLLTGWRGRLSPTLRKRVARHIEDCATCLVCRREQLSPAALLSTYAAPPFLSIEDSVWPRLARASADATVPPATVPAPRRAGRRATMAGLTLVALVLLSAGIASVAAKDGPDVLADPAVTPEKTVPAPAAGIPVAPAGTAQPAAEARQATTPRSAPAPAKSPAEARRNNARPPVGTTMAPSSVKATPTGQPSAQIAEAFTVSATTRVRCGRGTWTLVVTAEGTAALDAAELRWAVPGGSSGEQAMTVDGRTARVTLDRRREPSLTWSVRATAADGRDAGTEVATAAGRCPGPAA